MKRSRQSATSAKGLRWCYPAALPLPSRTLNYAVRVIWRRHMRMGSAWRKLTAGRSALLVLAYLRKAKTFTDLAAGFGAWHRDRLALCYGDRGPAGRPAGDDELTNTENHNSTTSRCHLPFCWAHEKRALSGNGWPFPMRLMQTRLSGRASPQVSGLKW